MSFNSAAFFFAAFITWVLLTLGLVASAWLSEPDLELFKPTDVVGLVMAPWVVIERIKRAIRKFHLGPDSEVGSRIVVLDDVAPSDHATLSDQIEPVK